MWKSLQHSNQEAKAHASNKSSFNSYVIALITTSLAGMFSVIGSYYTTQFQMSQAITQKHLEYRALAYTEFLKKIDISNAPAISQVLTIGSMAEYLATDSEIQAFEDRIFDLLAKHDAHDLYWQLNVELNILRLHGTPRVARTCDDILKILLFRDHEVDWTQYSTDVTTFYQEWRTTQGLGIAYGWEGRITLEERLMAVMTAKLTKVLIAQLRNEIHGSWIHPRG